MSYTRLRYHLVYATKGRKPLITAEVEKVIHRATIAEVLEFGGVVIAQGGIDDHQHVVAAIPPTIAICKAAGRMKAAGCKAVRNELKMPEFEWQVGYGCFTLNAHDFARVCRYALEQKQRHDRHDLIEAWEQCEG